MSFYFSDNDESEDDFDFDAFDDTGLLALASRNDDNDMKPAAAAAVATLSPATADSRGGAQNDMAVEESFGEEEKDGGGDWDNVNWEDADDDVEDSDDDTPQNFPTQGVMINFGKSNTAGKSNTPDNQEEDKKMSAEEKDETNNGKSKKRKRKTTRVLRNIPYETQQMILNVRRSGILCAVVQSMQYSYLCGSGGSESEDDNGMLLSTMAYSMVPQEFHNQKDNMTTGDQYQPTIPTKQQLHNFSTWFFTFVNQAGEHRRAALERNMAQGAVAASTSTTRQKGRRQSRGKKKQAAKKEGTYDDIDTSSQILNDKPKPINLLQTLMCLSPQYDEDPQLFVEEEDGVDAITAVENIASHEKVLLFLTMVRSLGWRARHVTALKPLSLELTVDHPLLSSFPVSGKKSSLGKNKTRQVHKLLGLLHKKKTAAAPTETIDLMSSDDEEDTKPKAKEMSTVNNTSSATLTTTPFVNVNSLSWVEILCRDDSSEKKQSMTMKKSDQPVAMWIPIHPEQESFDKPEEVESILAWMDMKSNSSQQQEEGSEKKKRKGKWGKAPSYTKRFANTFPKKVPVSYVLAVEHSLSKNSSLSSQLHGVRLTDVTPRYANTWSRTLRLRGATGKDLTKRGGKCVDEWWESSLKQMNRRCRSKQQSKKSPSKSLAVKSVTKTKTRGGKNIDLVELDSSDDEKATQAKPGYDSDEHEEREAKELTGGIEKKEKIPISKKGFKQSPFYVIPSVLNSQDVLHPDARKRICGVFKGEMVYKRSDVSKALRADKWLYQGRKVKESEIDKPAKKIKARKKSVAKGFNALSSYVVSEEAQEEMIASIDKNNKKKSAGDDQKMHNLYGIFQTEKWKPPHVGPNDAIPTNEFRNVELALINPGLTHMDRKGLAPIAKKLGIAYAPCMLGYEGSHAVVRGIVVHSHNVELMQMASVEYESHAVEKERENKRKEIIKKWKRLVVGLMTKERLDREYG